MNGIIKTIRNFLIGLGLLYITISILLLKFKIPGSGLLIGFITLVFFIFVAVVIVKLFTTDDGSTGTGPDRAQQYAKGIQDFIFRTGSSLKRIFKESKALSLVGLILLIIFCFGFVKEDLKTHKGLLGITLTTLLGDDSFNFKLSDLSKYEFYNPFKGDGKMTEKERAEYNLRVAQENRKTSNWYNFWHGVPKDEKYSKKNDQSDPTPKKDNEDLIYPQYEEPAPSSNSGKMIDAQRNAWVDDGVDYTNKYEDVTVSSNDYEGE